MLCDGFGSENDHRCNHLIIESIGYCLTYISGAECIPAFNYFFNHVIFTLTH